MTPHRVEVRYERAPIPVLFLSRPNRFLARVRALRGGRTFLAHVPNPGRMEELLLPGETLGWVSPTRRHPPARTSHDLTSVLHGRTPVSIDSRIANRLVARALASGTLSAFGRGAWRPEFPWDGCRWDFALPGRVPGGPPRSLLEVKSSNLRVGRVALFPDAPTLRGAHHLATLARASRKGTPAGLLMAVQRDDVDAFRPNASIDPAFFAAFRFARRAGVRIEARTLLVRPSGVAWGRRIPVLDA